MTFSEAILDACRRLSEENLGYPAFVTLLWKAGVESYTVRLDTLATRYSGKKGQIHAVDGGPARPVGAAWDTTALQKAVKASQSGELAPAAFMDSLAAAGISSFEARLGARLIVYQGHGKTFAQAIPK